MIRTILIRILLSPFALLYGLSISIRNLLYDLGLLKSTSFSIPVISIGNLTVGGAGKTPHAEYLINLLKDYINVATLSRGYKRKTKGFRMVEVHDNASTVGDEPLQFKRKHREIDVAVSESRTIGIPKLLMHNDQIQTIILDDGFQHRSVKPGLNILLTEYSKPFTKDYLLPAGRLREWKSSYRRADVIIVSKCPTSVSVEQKENIRKQLNVLPYQKLYFTNYNYGSPYYIFNSKYRVRLHDQLDVLLVSAIANSEYLASYLEQTVNRVNLVDFEDHHDFDNYDISRVKLIYDNLNSKNKVIITTEKDAIRFMEHKKYLIEHKIPIFALPIQVRFLGSEELEFNNLVKEYLLNFKI